ncbi:MULTISPECIES: hypothetical protein [unclassified Nonomuraea]|uniref:hypothetical protein n=1 Tax=unclassified Nonomuraea TaxID=2593643 RepID=UPI0033C21834
MTMTALPRSPYATPPAERTDARPERLLDLAPELNTDTLPALSAADVRAMAAWRSILAYANRAIAEIDALGL